MQIFRSTKVKNTDEPSSETDIGQLKDTCKAHAQTSKNTQRHLVALSGSGTE